MGKPGQLGLASNWRCEICGTTYVVPSLKADCITRHEKAKLHITD